MINVPIGLLADEVGPRHFLLAATVLFAIWGSYSFLAIEGAFASLLSIYLSGTVYLVSATTALPGILSDSPSSFRRRTAPWDSACPMRSPRPSSAVSPRRWPPTSATTAGPAGSSAA
ncbi:hypothetical protein ABZW30_43360 [Kitasatospora sp. NPDC004669]|uniref:hypothetical protein n=1 Tax=Kitasatospora sp. NPDC004669 TaxID=3154555 RepID=UPI0033AABF6A